MAENVKLVGNYLVYQGRPLVRNDKSMVYGSFKEAAYADMIILTEKEEIASDGKKYTVPDMIMVTILPTEKGKTEALRNQEFKQGLYNALEYSITQIERFNRK